MGVGGRVLGGQIDLPGLFRVKEPLDRCLDRLQSEFQENVDWYLQLVRFLNI